ncbi:5-carboxymethyl-2-hydroxymuconate Delta-isomerase [Polaromonas jejuensis]|uniref:5-carboxymethyl-2-hydroxymuconate Delta-isomerase n=1 Tax=Polaromonas jejuensis TaxID=457502 RepID=A0ABW0Q6C8_9BURK|nr:5-carboxymethyl-2-hydroxymuconate Delta-isomerase [Polaromonas jejuensis]
MPHLNIQYTANLDALTDMSALCRGLAATLVALRNDDNDPLFPVAGTRVMAWPAPHFAVADGQPDRAFIYLNLRITPGRSDALKKRAGDAVLASASAHLAPVFARHAIGLTLQIDEGAPVYEGKRNNLAEHLAKAATA